MQYTGLPGTGGVASRVVLGTDSLSRVAEPFALLDCARNAGINTFDTARIYGSEEILGRWLQERRQRADVLLVTKGGLPGPPLPGRLQEDCDASLRALRTDYIDCYLPHFDDESIPAVELLAALEGLRRQGKIRAFGFSNTRFDRLRAFSEICRVQGLPWPTLVSAHHGLLPWREPLWPNARSLAGEERRAEREWHVSQQNRVLAYSPLGRGFFRAERDAIPEEHFGSADNHERYRRAGALGVAKHASAAQIALAYLLTSSDVNLAVLGTCNPAHVVEGARAAQITLSPEERVWLTLEDRCFARGHAMQSA